MTLAALRTTFREQAGNVDFDPIVEVACAAGDAAAGRLRPNVSAA